MRKDSIVIVGTGGHAREVHEILLAQHDAGRGGSPAGFIEPDEEALAENAGRTQPLGGFGWLEQGDRSRISVICAVGTPSHCERLSRRIHELGYRFANAIAPDAWIARSASLGSGVMLFPGVVVNADARIGDHVTLNVGSSVSHDSIVGDFCSLGPGVRVAGNASLGAGCFVGMGANVIQGVRIGERTVVGAGAVVLEDLPAEVTAVGLPARVVGPASTTPLARRSKRP